MADGTWSFADAKAKLSEVFNRAERDGPQRITRHGREAGVLVSPADFREYELTRARSERSFFEVWADPRARVLTDHEHDTLFARDPDPGRPIDL